jgi:hypothetical protein
MSLAVTILIAPFTRFAARAQARETRAQGVLKPQLERIVSESAGEERHRRITNLYRRYAYHPVYSMRSVLGVMIQIPFLMGAYYMLGAYEGIRGRPFLFVADLSSPDAALLGINALPLLMTAINMLSACVTPGFGERETGRAWIIALAFAALLYNAPSALMIFWSCNNLWGLLENLRAAYVSERKNPLRLALARAREVLGRTPVLDAGSRFTGISAASALLIGFHAVTSSSLSADDFAGCLVALIVAFVLLVCAMFSLAAGKFFAPGSPWLVLPQWMCAIFLGGAIFDAFWAPDAAITGTIEAGAGALKPIIRIVSSLSGGNLTLLSAMAAALFAYSLAIFFASGRGGAGDDDGDGKKWRFALVALSAAVPATLHASLNRSYLTAGTIWIYYAVLIAISFAVHFAVAFLLRRRLSSTDAALMSAAYMLCLMMSPSVERYFRRYGSPTLAFAVAFLPAAAWLASGRRRVKSAACCLLASWIFPFYMFWNGPPGAEDSYDLPFDNSYIERTRIAEGDRASVYSLVYDAIPDVDTLKALGVDASPLEKILSDNGFKIYHGTYSLGSHSFASMGGTYNMMDPAGVAGSLLKDSCAGDGGVWRIFRANAYGTCNIQSDYMTRGKILTDDYFPPKGMYSHEINSLFVLLRGIFIGEFRFDATGVMSFSEEDYHKFLRENAARKAGPWFTAMHVDLPGHSQNSGKLLPNETELFVERYEKVLPEIQKDIETILREKPSSIIVVMGDHGPYLTGDGVMLGGYSADEITELMMRDRFGTLIAIRWPDPERAALYDSALLINQDIFPVVFAYLSRSYEPLKLMIKEKRAVFSDKISIEDGVFIKRP